jgi:hypothetical protein
MTRYVRYANHAHYVRRSFWLTAILSAVILVTTPALIALAQQPTPLCGQGVTYQDYSLVGPSLVKREGNRCISVVEPEQLPLSPLSEFMEQDSARQLMLKRYQAAVAAKGSVKRYERALAQHIREMPMGTIFYLRPESAWALNGLGIRIPASPYVVEMGS